MKGKNFFATNQELVVLKKIIENIRRRGSFWGVDPKITEAKIRNVIQRLQFKQVG